jgi:hypothetical protein
MSVVIATKQIEEVIIKLVVRKHWSEEKLGMMETWTRERSKKKKKKKKVEGKAEGREGTTHGNVGVTETM